MRKGNGKRKKLRVEEVEKHEGEKPLEHTNKSTVSYNHADVDNIHYHEDIKPKNLTKEHVDAIKNYIMGPKDYSVHHNAIGAHQSRYMNSHLRHLADKSSKKPDLGGHSEAEVENGIHRLSSAFTKENTNRKPVIVHTSVPSHIGEKIESSSPGTKHTLAGFTSTTTNHKVAKEFSDYHHHTTRGEGKQRASY